MPQDTDAETGQRVLTNFMLPQQPDDDGSEGAAAFGTAGNGGGGAAGRNAADNVSDNGSFHASAWEEERLKRSHVRWAGEQQQQQQPAVRGTSNSGREDQGPLRREPTPFPKEMRAMAKRMQNLRQTGKEAALAGSMVTSHGGSEYRQDVSLIGNFGVSLI